MAGKKTRKSKSTEKAATVAPAPSSSSSSSDSKVVQASLLTKSQLTTVIVVALGLSRFLQLFRVVNGEDATLCAYYLGATACASEPVQTLLGYKFVTGIQALTTMVAQASLVVRNEICLSKLCSFWMLFPLGGLLATLYASSDAFATPEEEGARSVVYRQGLLVAGLWVVAMPEAPLREFPFSGSRDAADRKFLMMTQQPSSITGGGLAALPRIAALTAALLAGYQAVQQAQSSVPVLGSSGSSDDDSSSLNLLSQLIAVDYATMAVGFLWAWRYVHPLQRFWRNVGLVHLVAYQFQWPLLLQFGGGVKDSNDSFLISTEHYESMRMASLTVALVAALLWLCPTTSAKAPPSKQD